MLEIAVGTGRNLEHYPPGVRLTGIELSDEMLAIARRRATDTGVEVELRTGDAQALEFPDESFDTVVITFALCTIPDDRAAVVVLTNLDATGASSQLANRIASMLFRATGTDQDAVQALAQAKNVFDGLQHGRIDRALLTSNEALSTGV